MTKIVNSILLVAIGVLVLYGSWNLTIWMYRAILGVPALERRIEADLKSALLIQTRAHLVNPKTIERSEGKAKRIIDRRAVPTSA